MKTETIKLEFPIQLADRLLEEVTMRRPTMLDLRKHPVKGIGDITGEMKQMCALTGLRLEEMDMMDSADYARLQEVYLRFRTPADGRGDSISDLSADQADALEFYGNIVT